MTALVTVTLQIAYLPTLYAALTRRETEIGLLNHGPVTVLGAGVARRTYYALGLGTSTLDTLPELYAQSNAGRAEHDGKPRHLLARWISFRSGPGPHSPHR